jgi:hypothetical protein
MDRHRILKGLATASALFSTLAGGWAVISGGRRRGVDADRWGVLDTGRNLFLGQGTVSVLRWLAGTRLERGIHVLYGTVMAPTLRVYLAFRRGRDDRPAIWVDALLCFFLVGISLRASGTGG